MRYLFFIGLLFEAICIVHAARTGRLQPWVYIIVFLPVAGTIAYIVVELIPDLIYGREGRKARQTLLDMIDPQRRLRRAQREASLVDSVEAKTNLAQEFLRLGDAPAAVAAYESAMAGMHGDDPALLSGLARARLAAGDGADAQGALDALRAAHPDFDSADAHLIYAQALEVQDLAQAACEEYEALVRYYPGEEARFRYASLLLRAGRAQQGLAVLNEIIDRAKDSPAHYRRMQREWISAAKRELKALPAPG